MNPYPKLKNEFWLMRGEFCFSSTQADLYDALLHISNGLYWKNPFGITNASLCAKIGISEVTLIASRNVLKQRGLIDFKSNNKRNEATVYRLLHLELYLKNLSTNNDDSNLYLKNLSTNDSTKYSTKYSTNYENGSDIIVLKENTNTFLNERGNDFFEKKISPAPFEKNKEDEISFLRNRIFELEKNSKLENTQPKEKKVPQKKENEKEGFLFSESEVATFEEFEKRFIGTEYQNCDLRLYFQKAKNWSDSNNKKKFDWIATVKTWMLDDNSKGKKETKNTLTTESKRDNGNVSLNELKSLKNSLKNV